MQFKHFLYWTAICCSILQVLLACYSRYYAGIAVEIDNATLDTSNCGPAILKALNYVLPISAGCFAILLYTWKYNKVNPIALLFACCLQAAAVDLNMRAARHVFGEEMSLASITWWAPTQSQWQAFLHNIPGIS